MITDLMNPGALSQGNLLTSIHASGSVPTLALVLAVSKAIFLPNYLCTELQNCRKGCFSTGWAGRATWNNQKATNRNLDSLVMRSDGSFSSSDGAASRCKGAKLRVDVALSRTSKLITCPSSSRSVTSKYWPPVKASLCLPLMAALEFWTRTNETSQRKRANQK